MLPDFDKFLTFDLVIIGSGSAGISAAIQASELGAKILLIGEGTIGGTCVNWGCVPSKAMIRAVEIFHSAKYASRFIGIEAAAKLNSWKKLIDEKQALVNELRQIKYINVLQSYNNITYIEGHAKLTQNAVVINNTHYITKKTIIATGASPSLPNIDGINNISYLTSTTALELENLPKSLLVIGGGIIGVELGQMFARAGALVTICCRTRLLPEAEPELSENLEKYLKEEGINICKGISYQKIETIMDGIRLTCKIDDNAQVIEAEKILIATGRTPNTNDMDLEKTGITLLKNKGIAVNEYMQSSNPNIYAIGDATGTDMFVYMGAYGGKLAATNAIKGNNKKYDNSIMPSVVFTDPQVANVGLTESQAKQQGYDIKTSIIALKHIPRFIVSRDDRGLIKLVADKKTDKLLGAHILAPEAGDLIQTAAMALKAGFTTEILAEFIFPYLTGVEGIKLAAQAFKKNINKLSCCAG